MVVLFVIFAPLDGVSDRIATGQGVGAPGIDNTTGRRGDEVDTRLVLQIGMLLALLYVAFVCMWLSRTRGGWAPGDVIHRLRSRWSEALADAWARLVGRPRAGVALEGPSVCSIAWKPGHHRSRFQAVISTPGGRRVVAESDSLPWPPKDARNPPTREIEAALASLVAKVVAEGWEPVQSDGPWTERRFVSRSTNLVALDVGGSVVSCRAGSRSPWSRCSSAPPRSAAWRSRRRSNPAGERPRAAPRRRRRRSCTKGCACASPAAGHAPPRRRSQGSSGRSGSAMRVSA
jgi:hypothetical protein